MARKHLFRTPWFPYHVTSRTNNRIPFDCPLPIVWEMTNFELWRLSVEFEIEIHGFVLMPNHFHLMVTVPVSDLGRAMHPFLKNVARGINKNAAKSGHVFGGPYHWTSIQTARYFTHALKYIYRNPVRAGICNSVEQYPFSTLSGLIGNTALHYPIRFTRAGLDTYLPGGDPLDWLPWLNTPFSAEASSLIRDGLRKREFTQRIDPVTRKPCPVLEQVL